MVSLNSLHGLCMGRAMKLKMIAPKTYGYTPTIQKKSLKPESPLPNHEVFVCPAVGFRECTPRKFYIAPRNRKSQKETHLPTIIFRGELLNFQGANDR